MTDKAYHHGNLKKELLEKGLKYINENGVESLSMRKLAAVCGVSSGAPYAHFKTKEEFLAQARDYVAEQFTESLMNCIRANKDQSRLLVELGVSYVVFFKNNPYYHHFLFLQGGDWLEQYPPYKMFSETAFDSLTALGYKADDIKYKTLAMWSMVQGLADICTSHEVLDSDRLEDEIARVLCAVTI